MPIPRSRSAAAAATLLIAVALAAPAAAQTTYTTTDPPVAIPDNSPGTPVCQTITVPAGTGLLTALSVEVAATHTWTGDVTVRLSSPAAAQLDLFSRPGVAGPAGPCCGNSANLSSAVPLSLDDGALSGISAEQMGLGCSTSQIIGGDCPPDNYTPDPDGGLGTNLAQYDGIDPEGIWTLCATDSASLDTGTLTSWSLIATTEVPCGLTCPADVLASVPFPGNSAVVTFPDPGTSGACGPVTCTPASGSTFPLGTTPVTCGNASGSATCTFDVTVEQGAASVLEIPTASETGLIVLALLLAGSALVALRRGR